jgi:hypothetical protein
MNRSHALGFSERELAILNASVDAGVLDEDAWEDATTESGVDRERLCHSKWRASMFDSAD